MSYVPKGHKFFTEVLHCAKGSQAYGWGIRTGYVIECEKLNDDSDGDAAILFRGKRHKIIYNEESPDLLAIYAGELDGTGFICDKVKAKAMRQLKNTYCVEEY